MKTFLLFTLLSALITSQKAVVSGTVTDQSGQPLAQASIVVKGTHVSVVTNDDGFFTLKVDELPQTVVISHVGYKTRHVQLTASQTAPLRVRLQPATIQLSEVVVWRSDPYELVDIAISKIPENYSRVPELYNCFYRETAMKRKHYIYVAEGVLDMYKTAYNNSTMRDRVAIRKGRRLLSQKQSDTLGIKVNGGPVQPIQLDLVKNLDFLLNKEELSCYEMKMEMPEVINNRTQYVVSLSPREVKPYALYFGKLYIDRETLAFTRAELSLDMSNREKATRLMLVKKPLGVRFRPKELSCLIDYRYVDGVTHISYIRNTFRFNCDWKKRLFATSFTACCEMVVTDKSPTADRPLSGRTSFDSHEAFYDRVDYFLDPHFWEDYNIIEPSESLDRAIDRLVKRRKK